MGEQRRVLVIETRGLDSKRQRMNEVVQALEDQLGCYQRLAKLAELQHVHVQQNQTEALLDVLQRRQLVLDEITQLERVIGPAKKNWSDYSAGIDAGDRLRAEGLLSRTRELLEAITQSDQHDALVLQQRKLNVGKQINQASSARQVNRTYAAAAYGKRASRMDLQR
jgi:hypothetical protein